MPLRSSRMIGRLCVGTRHCTTSISPIPSHFSHTHGPVTDHTSTMQLGSLTLQSRIMLAPLERVSDAGFRMLCFKNGAAFTWTEMVYAAALARKNPAAVSSIDTHDPATPTGVQLLVTSSKMLEDSLTVLEEGAASYAPHWNNISAIDLNFGCPSPDVIKRGGGPAMIKRRKKLTDIFTTLARWKASTPLEIHACGAKIRLGLNAQEQKQEVYLPIAEIAAEHLDYLVVHARHGLQRSRDPVSWEAIGQIKRAVHGSALQIIGNGNVTCAADLKELYGLTGCDGIMIGRAAIDNPWVFRTLMDPLSDAAVWPLGSELDAAVQEYKSSSPTYTRFRSFHERNFRRIQEGISMGVAPAKVKTPSGKGTTKQSRGFKRKQRRS